MKHVFSLCIMCLTLLTGCSDDKQPPQSDHLINQTLYTAITHSDRSDIDRQRDERRKPAQVLEFLGVSPGMTVIEIMAGGGYYTELLSRVVGRLGKVYSHNNKLYYEFQSDKFVEQRLKNNRLPNVIRWDKELNDLQLPDDSIDAVFLMLVYHDFYWSEDNPEQILADLYQALKPGGTVAIVDHSAKSGSGTSAANKMHGIHRIDEQLVKQSFEKAGFILNGESALLRNAADTRDKPFFDKSLIGKPTDRFVLRYRKQERKPERKQE
ncbi:MAG: class I SAM-dependent methyltransferase [Algicola sp.]|nr:class I SAM-dependent methyltransferase [Algicola sp.]